LGDIVKKLAAEWKVAKKTKKTDEEKPVKEAPKKATAKKTTKKE
jgi:hypothetical protein